MGASVLDIDIDVDSESIEVNKHKQCTIIQPLSKQNTTTTAILFLFLFLFDFLFDYLFISHPSFQTLLALPSCESALLCLDCNQPRCPCLSPRQPLRQSATRTFSPGNIKPEPASHPVLHLAIQMAMDGIICRHCKSTFSSRNNLFRHVRKECPKMAGCRHCKRKFPSNNRLHSHLRRGCAARKAKASTPSAATLPVGESKSRLINNLKSIDSYLLHDSFLAHSPPFTNSAGVRQPIPPISRQILPRDQHQDVSAVDIIVAGLKGMWESWRRRDNSEMLW